MSESLEALLTSSTLDPIRSELLKRVLSHPAAVPRWGTALLEDRGCPLPEPQPGQPLLLAATTQTGSLWTTTFSQSSTAVELVGRAREAWFLAGEVAARVLPIAGDPEALLRDRPPRAEPLYHGGTLHMGGIDGESFGLAFCLAHISSAAGIPIASDLAATACIDAELRVHPVCLLQQKLTAVRSWAPGIRRLLVAKDQLEEAEELAPWLRVYPIERVDEAWPLAFETQAADRALQRRWERDPAAAAKAAENFLIRLIIDETRTKLSWAAVARGAALLRSQPDPEVSWQAKTAYAIASCRAGSPLRLPDSPPGLGLKRSHRVALAAHAVQACNDCVDDDWRAVATQALTDLAVPGDEDTGDLQVLGALGRLYSVWGDYQTACKLLVRAIDTWLYPFREPHEASRPICQLLWIAGVTSDEDLLEKGRGYAERCLASVDRASWKRAFLQLALGRALLGVGDPRAALSALADNEASWAESPAHVRASRLRWLARVGPGPEQARSALQRLAAREPAEAHWAWVLARADAGEATALAELAPHFARAWERIQKVEPDSGLQCQLDLFPY